MKILFAPSEAKKSGGETGTLDISNFSLQREEKKRVTNLYNDYLKDASDEALMKLFGVKKDLDRYKSIDIFHSPLLPAIERYSGVAFEYLDYFSLKDDQKAFLNENLIIFSNLFGALRAYELIPEYKLKQGEKIGDFVIEKFYLESSSEELDAFFGDALIIDLRAGFYEKFYIPKRSYITMKFIKNGKVVSHWAKAYRGKIVRELSMHQPQTERDLTQIEFEDLRIVEIQEKKRKKEYIFEIIT